MVNLLLGQVVVRERIIPDGAVVVEDNIIKFVGRAADVSAEGKVFDFQERIIAPGFVDIHCHAGGGYFSHEDPQKMAEYHRRHGTTAMLCTFYRNLTHEEILLGLERVKEAMQVCPNIVGVHMEGPYLNPKYGTQQTTGVEVNPAVYRQYLDSGLIRQWTYAPEVSGTSAFLKDLLKADIVPAIGHSCASPEQVYASAREGAKIVTHLMNATGSGIDPTRWGGTREVSFDEAALLCDSFFYELICDRAGIHVRPDMIKLIIKTVGIDRIVGITDNYGGVADESDVNIKGRDLMGSKLTMDLVARNFLKLGLDLPEVFQIVSTNPAKAIGFDHAFGSICEGCRGDFVITDKRLETVECFCC